MLNRVKVPLEPVWFIGLKFVVTTVTTGIKAGARAKIIAHIEQGIWRLCHFVYFSLKACT